MYSPCDSKASVGRIVDDRIVLSPFLSSAKTLLPLIVVAALWLPVAAQDAEVGIEPVVTSVVVEDIFVAQPPKPKAKPAAPAPAKKAPAAAAKKPPRRDGEPADEPPPRPARERRVLVPDLGLLAFRTPSLRLASVPNMLGDFPGQGGQIQKTGLVPPFPTADFPAAGGGRRVKIAENNKALPMNRYYIMYHHFHSALTFDPGSLGPGGPDDFSVNRYTIGLERTFADDLWSADVRMPFYETYQTAVPGFGVEAGEIGNLSVAVKRLLAESDDAALAAGLVVETPTGSDAIALIDTATVTQHNQAVHLSPYVGYVGLPTDALFCHGFLQLDIPLNGNRVDFVDPVWVQSGTFGILNDQTLLHVDVSAGYWLYRDPDASVLTGFASLLEFHYTTTLQDADIFNTAVPSGPIQLGNLLNRVDVANMTVGLHAELFNNTTLRVSGVFPLQDNAERPFDAEVNVSLNRYY